MQTRVPAVLVVLACAVLAACAGRQTSADTAAEPQVVAEPVDSLVLEVENHNWSDVIVSIVHDGVTTRFTEVTAGTDKSLVIPGHLVGQLGRFRLLVRGIGSEDRFLSETLSVRTGSTVRLTVESRVVRSSVGVW